MRKVDEQDAKVLQAIFQEKDRAFELNGRKYKIVTIDSKNDSETTVAEDVERNPELRKQLLEAKKNITRGNYFTSEEIQEMIRNGQV